MILPNRVELITTLL